MTEDIAELRLELLRVKLSIQEAKTRNAALEIALILGLSEAGIPIERVHQILAQSQEHYNEMMETLGVTLENQVGPELASPLFDEYRERDHSSDPEHGKE